MGKEKGVTNFTGNSIAKLDCLARQKSYYIIKVFKFERKVQLCIVSMTVIENTLKATNLETMCREKRIGQKTEPWGTQHLSRAVYAHTPLLQPPNAEYLWLAVLKVALG